jgi:uncharacterized OsmC-like protein
MTIMNTQTPEMKKFKVSVKRISQEQAVAETHGQKITLAIQGKDPNLGFTAPETVLAAFGACILSNVTKGAMEMRLQVNDASIEFEAIKRLEPLGYEDLQYTLTLHSPEPPEKLQALYDRATTDGTATRALLEGLKPQGKLSISK